MNCSKYRKVVAVIFVVFLFSAFLGAADRDYDAVADKIVNYSLKVQPGESVVINGTPADLDLLSSLVVAVYKAGGLPTTQLFIPEAYKRAMKERPMEYLNFVPTYGLMQMRVADCFINIQSSREPGYWDDIPEEKLAAIRKAQLPVQRAALIARSRAVNFGQNDVGIPTETFAKTMGADHTQMLEMFWNSVSSDYQGVQKTGEAISRLMSPHAEVEVTSSAGTNVRFKLGSTPAGINAGRTGGESSTSGTDVVWLPAGEVWAAADISSASGTVIVPEIWIRDKKIENLRMDFKNGILDAISADNDMSALTEILETAEDDEKVLSLIDIGLNPDSHPLKGSSYYSYEMAGVVTIGIGLNTWAGGDFVSDVNLNLLIPDTTVKIGGRTVVGEGKLAVK